MTKETRVALLVGLAFIVLFGLILSYRSSHSSGVPNAPTMVANPALAPAPVSTRPNPEIRIATTAMGDEPDNDRAMGPGARGAPPRRDLATSTPPGAGHGPATPPARPGEPLRPPVILPVYPAPLATPLGPTPVALPPGRLGPVVAPIPPASTPIVQPVAGRTHTVAAGDTLYKLARRYYGREGEYRRILNANKDKLRDPAKLVVGAQLRIPDLPAAPAPLGPAPVASPGQRPVVTPASRPVIEWLRPEPVREVSRESTRQPARPPARGPVRTLEPVRPGAYSNLVLEAAVPPAGRTYVVQPGDTLVAIARREMGGGSGANVQKLMDANRGVLSDPGKLRPGMKLRIP